MSSKAKSEFLNNLLNIRKNLGKTQREMAEILEVSPEMYGKYERATNNFPLARAMKLAKEHLYSLDYIYALDKKVATEKKMCIEEKRKSEFMVDIRDLIGIDNNNNLTISIADSYMDYFFKKSKIQNDSRKTIREKNNLIALLDGEFSFNDNSAVIEYNVSMNESKSYYKLENEKIPFFYDEIEPTVWEHTNDKVKKLRDFLEEVNRDNGEE